ncbi:MAG: LysM peptidoglycan-binding domain-containing protein [Acidimicrobiales bacterium]
MGALAHTDRGAPRWLAGTEPNRPRSTPARQRRSATRRQANWNVLAQELVPFPPAAELSVGHPGQRASRRTGPAEATRAFPSVPAPSPLTGRPAAAVQGGSGRTAAHASTAAASAARVADRASSARSGQAASRSRGLRRLLPGAATLAFLAGVWFGAGALSNMNRAALTVPAATVKISGGYLYIARPGDTLWSIASKLQPGGDPRPLVAELEQQLHGAGLVAGDRLKLP